MKLLFKAPVQHSFKWWPIKRHELNLLIFHAASKHLFLGKLRWGGGCSLRSTRHVMASSFQLQVAREALCVQFASESMRLKPFGRNLRSYLLRPHGRLALCWCFKALKSPGPKSRVTQMQRRACLVTEWIHGFHLQAVNFETFRFWMISTISQLLAGKVTPRHDISLLFCAHGSICATYHVSHQATSEASSKVEEEAVCVWVVKICGSGASYHIHAISSADQAETVEVEGLVMKSMERSSLWDSIGFIAFFWPKAVPCMAFFCLSPIDVQMLPWRSLKCLLGFLQLACFDRFGRRERPSRRRWSWDWRVVAFADFRATSLASSWRPDHEERVMMLPEMASQRYGWSFQTKSRNEKADVHGLGEIALVSFWLRCQ